MNVNINAEIYVDINVDIYVDIYVDINVDGSTKKICFMKQNILTIGGQNS
jgi:hypothetical protein